MTCSQALAEGGRFKIHRQTMRAAGNSIEAQHADGPLEGATLSIG
jgi:hypothetical protein